MDHGHITKAIGIHTILAFEYADATEREADGPFAADEKGKAALQFDDGSFWLLTDISGGPSAWAVLLTGGAPLGGDLNGTLPNPRVMGVGGSQLVSDGSGWADVTKAPDHRMRPGRALTIAASFGSEFAYDIDDTYSVVVGVSGIFLVNILTGVVETIPVPGYGVILNPTQYQIMGVVYDGQQDVWFLGNNFVDNVFMLWKFALSTFYLVTGYQFGPDLSDGSVVQAAVSVAYADGYLFVSFLDSTSGNYRIAQLAAGSSSFLRCIDYPDPAVSLFGANIIGGWASCSTSTQMGNGWENYVWYSAVVSPDGMAAVRLNPSTTVHRVNDVDNVFSVGSTATDQSSMEAMLSNLLSYYNTHLEYVNPAPSPYNWPIHTYPDTYNHTYSSPPVDPPGGPYTNSMAVANSSKQALINHLLNRGSHFYRDVGVWLNLSIIPDLTDDTDLVALFLMTNALHEAHNAHMSQSSQITHNISRHRDFASTYPRPFYSAGNYQDGDCIAAFSLMNDLANKYMQHLTNPHVHQNDDTINVITASGAYDPNNWPNVATFLMDMAGAFQAHVQSSVYHPTPDNDHSFIFYVSADDWFGILKAINHNLTQFDMHIASGTYHVAPDTVHGIFANSSTMSNGVANLDQLLINLQAHAASTAYHLVEDVSSLPTRTNDVTPHFPSLMALINDFAHQLLAHVQEAGVHEQNDYLTLYYLTSWTDLTDDTNLQDMILTAASFGTNGYHGGTGGIIYDHYYVGDPSLFAGTYNAHISANSAFLEVGDAMIPSLPAAIVEAMEPMYYPESSAILLLGGQTYMWMPLLYIIVKEELPGPYYPYRDFPAGYMYDELDLALSGSGYTPYAPLSVSYNGNSGRQQLWVNTSNYSVNSNVAHLMEIDYDINWYTLLPASFPVTYPRSNFNVGSVATYPQGFDSAPSVLFGNTRTSCMRMLADDSVYPLNGDFKIIPLGGALAFSPKPDTSFDPEDMLYINRPPFTKLVGYLSIGAVAVNGVGGFIPVLPYIPDLPYGATDHSFGLGGVVAGYSQLDDVWIIRLSLEATASGDHVSAALYYKRDEDSSYTAIPNASVTRDVPSGLFGTVPLDIHMVVKGLSSARLIIFPMIAGGSPLYSDIVISRMCFTVEKA